MRPASAVPGGARLIVVVGALLVAGCAGGPSPAPRPFDTAAGGWTIFPPLSGGPEVAATLDVPFNFANHCRAGSAMCDGYVQGMFAGLRGDQQAGRTFCAPRALPSAELRDLTLTGMPTRPAAETRTPDLLLKGLTRRYPCPDRRTTWPAPRRRVTPITA